MTDKGKLVKILEQPHFLVNYPRYTLGEKLAVFIEFKKRDPSDLRPQDDRKRLIDKH
jgi:hypothetical protein